MITNDKNSNNSIEDELGIPIEATLPSSSFSSFRVASLRTTQGAVIPLVTETLVRQKTTKQQQQRQQSSSSSLSSLSIRGLVVGRQASTSDIRIQHGSISRRHGIFFYLPSSTTASSSSSSSSLYTSYELILRDLKGKHGIVINGERIPSGSQKVLKQNDSIVFGNVRETRFHVQFNVKTTTNTAASAANATNTAASSSDIFTAKNTSAASSPSDIFTAKNTSASSSSSSDTNSNSNSNTNNINDNNNDNDKTKSNTNGSKMKNENSATNEKKINTIGNSIGNSREQREAEIRAMTESLDEKPSYTKHTPSPSSYDHANNNIPTTATTNNYRNNTTTGSTNQDLSNDMIKNDNVMKAVQKYQLPIQELFPISIISNDEQQRQQQQQNSNSNDDRKKDIIVTCISIDPAGSRFICGSNISYEGESIRMFDFGGMDRLRTNPFKTVVIEEGNKINDVAYSNTGDRYIVATGSTQPKILDRDGYELLQFVRGDMYVSDQKHTMGHTGTVCSVDWHPFDRNIVLTSSYDGSARLWDIAHGKKQFQMLCCTKVFSIKNKMGKLNAGGPQGNRKIKVCCVTFHPNGYEFAVGTDCGSIQIWNTRKNIRPERVKYDVIHYYNNSIVTTTTSATATTKPTPVYSLVYDIDGSKLASRSCMNSSSDCNINGGCNNSNNNGTIPCCNIWDARRLSSSSKPIAICSNVPSVYDRSNSSFNPNGTILCVGTSEYASTNDYNEQLQKQQKVTGGRIKFFHTISSSPGTIRTEKTAASSSLLLLEPIVDIEISKNAGVIIVEWHKKLNQIFLGCSDGRILILFDTPNSKSKKKKMSGALLPYYKAGRQIDGLSQLIQSRAPTGSVSLVATGHHNIITPFALPMFQDNNSRVGFAGHKRKQGSGTTTNDRSDPIKSHKPEPPATGIKTGGQSSAVVNFTQFVVDSKMKNNNDTTKGDKTIAGSKDPREELFKYREGKTYINQAYIGNKEVILAEKTVEQEEEEMRQKKK